MDLSFFELLMLSGLKPFTIAGVIIIAVLALELVMMLVGASLFGDGDGDIDLDSDLDMDVDADLEAAFDVEDITIDHDVGGLWGFLELGKVPVMISFLGYAAGFAIVGFFLQLALLGMIGYMMPVLLAVAVTIVPAVVIGKFLSRGFAAVIPKTTTDAISRTAIGGAVGKILTGTATVDLPAEARVTDRNGNPHIIRVIPFTGEQPLKAGTEIVALRGPGPVYAAMALTTAKQLYNQK